MTKKQSRQHQLIELLKQQGTGITSIPNWKLSSLLGVSKRTIKRDLEELDGNGLIIRETHILTSSGTIKKQRDIIIPNYKEPIRRFSLNQHKQLSTWDNHRIHYNTEWIWERCVDGVWERVIPDKEFQCKKKLTHWIIRTIKTHQKHVRNGDKYISRSSINT